MDLFGFLQFDLRTELAVPCAMKMRPLLMTSVFAATFAAAGAASAMAPPPCMPAAIAPNASGIVIPANIPGFGYTAVKAAEKDVHLFSTTGTQVDIGVNVGPVEGQYLEVTPKTPLVPGNTYRLEYDAFCQYGGAPSKPLTFTAGADAPLPTKLADLVGAPTVTTKDFGTTQYTVVATFALSPEMKPWLDVYQVALSVDGKLVSTLRAAGANDSFTATATGWCDATNAATKIHKVQLKARLPFAPAVESAVTDLTFDCPAPKIATSPPYTGPTGGTGGGGTTLPGASSSGGSGSGTSTPGTSSSGGCAIAMDSQASSPLALGAIALGLAAAVSRRRRR